MAAAAPTLAAAGEVGPPLNGKIKPDGQSGDQPLAWSRRNGVELGPSDELIGFDAFLGGGQELNTIIMPLCPAQRFDAPAWQFPCLEPFQEIWSIHQSAGRHFY